MGRVVAGGLGSRRRFEGADLKIPARDQSRLPMIHRKDEETEHSGTGTGKHEEEAEREEDGK